MKVITSRQNPKVKALVVIKNKPGDTLFIEGLHLIEMAQDENLVIEYFGVKTFPLDVSQTFITDEIAEKLSDKKSTDGFFALIHRPKLNLDYAKHLLYLDDVRDPGNMGTLIRTALAFDFGGIIYSETAVDPYNQKVLSAGQGAHFRLPLLKSDEAILKSLKKNDYKVLVTTLKDAKKATELASDKYVVVLGNEARGVSQSVAQYGDINVKIPIVNIESLNVSVAGAILMYELSKIKSK